jgi:hypothetical protein
MTDAEHWHSMYLRACERCRTLMLIRAATEIQETIGRAFVAEALRDLDGQRFLSKAAEETVAQLFAMQFGRCPDGRLLGPLH